MTDSSRPVFAVGHMRMPVEDVEVAYDFFVRHGMRAILKRDEFGILELRAAPISSSRKRKKPLPRGSGRPSTSWSTMWTPSTRGFVADGVVASDIERGDIHDSFPRAGTVGVFDPDQLVARGGRCLTARLSAFRWAARPCALY